MNFTRTVLTLLATAAILVTPSIVASSPRPAPAPVSKAAPVAPPLALIDTLSPEGSRFLQREEGGCHLRAYRDSTGRLTIGVGHTGDIHGYPIQERSRIDTGYCLSLFQQDLVPCEGVVAREAQLTVAQAKFDAQVSLCFNLGPSGYVASGVGRATLNGQFDQAAGLIMIHHYAGGRPYVLLRRRYREAQLYLTGTYVLPIGHATPLARNEP